MPDARRVLNWLGFLLLIAVVVPFVIYAVPGVIGAEGSYVVLSGSMEPSISTGDVVVVDGVDPADVEERDVITYLRNGADTPTTHRVVDITERGGDLAFVTQGDANDQPDPSPVPASQVMGQVILTIPYIGYVIEFGNTSTGFIALVVVPFALLLLSEVYSILAGNGSESDAEGQGERPAKPIDSGSAPAVSTPPVKAFATADPTATDADGPGIDPSVRRPIVDPTAVTANGHAATAGTAEESGESDDTVAFTRSDLRLTLAILTGVAVYAGWVVYNIQAAWSFAVAFGSGIGAILVGAMYYAAGSDDATESERVRDDGFRSAPVSERPSGANSELRTDGAPARSTEEDSEIESADRTRSEDADE